MTLTHRCCLEPPHETSSQIQSPIIYAGVMALISDITLRDLNMLIEVAQKRSFTDAAESLHCSQSAVSRSVNTTERRLGARIFVRTTRAVEPTTVGQELLTIANKILDSYNEGLNEFFVVRDGHKGHVRVAALPSISAVVLPSIVARMRESYPFITIDIDDVLAHDAADLLLKGDVDFAVTVDGEFSDGVTFDPLFTDRFFAVYHRGHHFSDRSSIAWKEFAEEPLVSFGDASSIRMHVEKTLNEISATAKIAVQAKNIAVIAGLVSRQFGVTAVPEFALPLMSFANLDASLLVDPSVERTIGLAYRNRRSPTPASQHFIAMLTQNSPPVKRV